MNIIRSLFDILKHYGVDANTAATLFITLFVFIAGYIVTWMGSFIKELQEKKTYKKSLLFLLSDFSKACEKQHSIISNSLTNASFTGGKDFRMSYVSIGTLDYLYRLDFNTVIQNLEPVCYNKNHSKAISKLFGLISYIKEENDNIFSNQKEFFESYKRYESLYYQSLDDLRKIRDGLYVEFNGKKIERNSSTDLIIGFLSIFDDWHQNGQKKKINSTHKEIILPIIELNRKHQNNPSILEINNIVLKADMAYMNISKVEEVMVSDLRSFAHAHRKAARMLKVIIKILD